MHTVIDMDTNRIINELKRANAARLAELSGVSLRAIFRIREGHPPRLSTLERLAPHIKRATRKDAP